VTDQELAQEIGYLRDLFQRKLLDDKSKNQLIESLQSSLGERDALAKGDAFRDVFRESLVALDRLRSEEPGAELVESVREELLEVFARRGLQPVSTDGIADPRFHEVIDTVASTDEITAGQIVYVEREGYLLGERLLRPARVVVAVEQGEPAA